MFDWNDQELANTVWCEGCDTDDDHNMRQTEKFIPQTSSRDELCEDLENFQIPPKGDFVDDGWASIGSFNDLDIIFSNDDPIYNNVSLGNGDELWSSSKDVTNGPVKSYPISVDSLDLGLGSLSNMSQDLEIKTEYVPEDDKFFTLCCGKTDDPAYHGLQNSNAKINHVQYAGTRSKPVLKQKDPVVAEKTTVNESCLTSLNFAVPNEFADKFYRQRKKLKIQESEERNKGNVLQNLYDRWPSPGQTSGQFKNQLLLSMLYPSSILVQQRQLQEPESSHNQRASNQFVPPSAYENLTHPYPTMSMLYHKQSGELKYQALLSGFTVSPMDTNSINKSADTSATHQIMTPQEKIDKLRRQQQMKAMLAIQKQQQQFNNQISSSDHCATQNVGGLDLEAEYLSNPPSFDPCSTMEHNGSNAISVAVDGYSWKETILYQLQEAVAKLDMRIRLCIRDSLFQLCQNAVQRRYAGDTSSTNREEHGTLRQEISRRDRYARTPMMETETETNHI